ncbi:MAG: hypothetical protein VB835_18130 [Pirellulales bacterium]
MNGREDRNCAFWKLNYSLRSQILQDRFLIIWKLQFGNMCILSCRIVPVTGRLGHEPVHRYSRAAVASINLGNQRRLTNIFEEI